MVLQAKLRQFQPGCLVRRDVLSGGPEQTVQIRARDLQASSGKRLVPVVLFNRGYSELDFVVAQLALEGAGRLVFIHADDGIVDDVVWQVLNVD